MNLKVSVVPSAVFLEDQLQDTKAITAGCDPDIDAWTQSNNTPPVLVGGLRAGAGHVHIGYNMKRLMVPKHVVIRAMDVFLGSLLSQMDKDQERRKLYGKAGAYRDKKYGVEYRVPSNYWLTNSDVQDVVYAQVGKAMEYVESHPEETFIDSRPAVIAAVNFGHEGAFNDLVAKYGVL
jgi:hypothetical protein